MLRPKSKSKLFWTAVIENTFDDGKLIIESRQKRRRTLPKYDLNQLLEEQKLIQAELDKDRSWLHAKPAGGELL